MTAAGILVVEDDEATAELERRVLARSGMKVTVVGRVFDALALLRQQSFAAILLDYNLPDGDPWAIVEAADAKQPRIPVVLVTAQGSEHIASEAIHRGVADYVKKTDTFWDQLPGIVDRVASLARSDERMRRLEEFFERAHLGAAVAGPDGNFEHVNHAFAQMHGYSVEEMIGQSVASSYAPAWRERLPAILREVTEKGSLRFEAEHVKRDGSVFPVIVDTTIVNDPAGRPAYRAGYLQDITEQRRAEENLRASEAKANAILDAIPDLVFRVTGEGVYLDYRAPRTEELVVPGDQIVGRNLRELLPPALADEALARIRQTLDTGSVVQWEYRLDLPDAHLGTQDFEARIAPNGADEVIVIVRNVTAARLAERSILASLREKEVLLQEVHHRVKNNLQVVQSLLGLQQRCLSDATARAAIQDTARRVQAMALVHEKLYQSGDLSAISLPHYAGDLLAQIGEAHAAGRRGIQLRADIAELRTGLDNAVPFGLLLTELVSNSMKHAFTGRPGGEIWVRLTRQADGDLLIVADNGVGFAPGFELGAQRVSMGLQLACGLARQLGGELLAHTQDGASTQALLTRL